jgi:hypothetical protein
MINSGAAGRRAAPARPVTGERVIDWFCGLGNFTLPLGHRAREVLGIEGSETLVQRARDNAARNGLAERAQFAGAQPVRDDADDLQAYGPAERWLVDPPREGAFALAKALAEHRQLRRCGPMAAAERIVYVSCNPATLARDAGLLVHQAGYRCVCSGRGQHVSRTPRTWRASPYSTAAERHRDPNGAADMKKGARGAPSTTVGSDAADGWVYSRSPPKMPSSASRLWNTL